MDPYLATTDEWLSWYHLCCLFDGLGTGYIGYLCIGLRQMEHGSMTQSTLAEVLPAALVSSPDVWVARITRIDVFDPLSAAITRASCKIRSNCEQR